MAQQNLTNANKPVKGGREQIARYFPEEGIIKGHLHISGSFF